MKTKLTAILLMILLSACQGLTPRPTGNTPTPAENEPTQAVPLPVTSVTFHVQIPGNSPTGQPVFINILDEVTGLALNARSYQMERVDDYNYSLEMTVPVGSVIKYRYTRQGEAVPLEEHLSDARQVRYRIFYVQAPGEVRDVVSRWTDTEYSGPAGRIMGQALDAATGQPLPNLLITAGGAQALTTSDGSYLIEGLPEGVHNLVAYTLDGSYRTFQQGARVAADSTTPTNLRLSAAPLVNLIFVLTVPQGSIPAVPIRLAGNLFSLGNTFANLSGGVSTLSTRMPVLNVLPDGRYSVSLTLPAGADLRYTYTLGDGFWNTELTPEGDFRVRQLIVPEANGVLEDRVENWLPPDTAPITFDITVPPGSPEGETVYIQFNPVFGWTEPIPMWSLGGGRWAYVLNSPLGLTESLSYRFCRSGQCGAADDVQTSGAGHPGLPVSSSLVSQTIVEQVEAWSWMSTPLGEVETALPEISPRGPGFLAGVEFQPAYHPSWLPLLSSTLDDVQNLRANWVVFSPTWTYTRSSPPVLEVVTGQDALWFDVVDIVGQASARGLRMALFPSPRFPVEVDAWWSSAPRDVPWWQSWFERYRSFLLHHADLAARAGAPALILGGSWLTPALPGGALADGTPSGVPEDAEARWRQMLDEIRARYTGQILWALSDTQAAQNPPPFLDAVDSLYLLFSAPLSTDVMGPQFEMEAEAGRLLDNSIQPLYDLYGKPVILAAGYPSAEGSRTGCILDELGDCLDPQAWLLSPAAFPSAPLDLDGQVEIYSALLSAANLRPWITGFVARGYYPPTVLQDKSASIHGKPAQEVVGEWFSRLLEVPAP